MNVSAARSLRHKLTLLVTLTSGLVLSLACVALVLYDLQRARTDMESELQSLARVIGSNSTGALAFDDERAAGEVLGAMSAKPHVVSACLYDERGRPFAVYHRRGAEGDRLPPGPLPDAYRSKHGYVELFQRVMLGEEVAGTIYLKSDLVMLRSRLKAYLLVVLLVMLAGLGAASGLSTRLQKGISDPILRLTAVAAAVAERRDYSVRVANPGGDEIGRLAAAFNEMLSQIQRRDDELRSEMGERQNAEQALRVSEGKFRSIVETTNEWVWSMDGEGRSTYDNPAVTKILGRSAEAMLGASRLELLHPEDKALVQGMLPRLLVERKGFSGLVLRFRRGDGSYRTLESSCAPIQDAQGRVVGFQGSDRDITEGRLLEQQLRQAQKMEAVGRLAGGVAHDFNNLLGVMMGYSELMLGSELSPALRNKAEQIHRAGERAAVLTRQLLAFSRKQVLAPKVLDLNALVADFSRMLPRLLGEDIALSFESCPDLGQVKADPGQLEQILMNLAVNARDAMPDGGSIAVSTSNVVLDRTFVKSHVGFSEGRFVQLSVADSGCGMDPETQSHVFEPFFTTKAPGKGTGLGLATVYGIMKQSDGHISLESAPGRGTTFRLYFPRVDEQVEQRATRCAEPMRRGRETVLLVEDEEALRELLATMLSRLGHTVLAASSGEAALAMAETHPGPIHLLLTDVVMAGISGPEVARRLTSRRRETRVVYMSGHTDDALGTRGVLTPGTHLLAKPFSEQALGLCLRGVLEGARQEPPVAMAV